MQKEMAAHRTLQSMGQVAPSIGNTSVPTRDGTLTSTPPSGGRKKLYAQALSGKKGIPCKLTVKSKNNQPADAVKNILKSSIDPIDMKICIRTFKGLTDGKVIIEADTKEDIKTLNSRIRD
jgi:hypothetical protein